VDGLIDLGAYRLDHRLFPLRDLRRALLRASGDENAALLLYGDPQGYLPLRATIASRLCSHSIPAEPENILITNGALHGLDLSFRLLAREGGMDADVLRKRLRQRGLRFLFIIPSFQNPSGITTSRERRERVLALCESRGLPIVEDAFEEEMSCFGSIVLPLKSPGSGSGGSPRIAAASRSCAPSRGRATTAATRRFRRRSTSCAGRGAARNTWSS
jgi:DNA-binding transcriptional MocR family regulator